MNGKTPDRSTGQEKHESRERQRRERKRLREGCHYCIQYLVPDTAILLCPYSHSQQLEIGADGTSIYPRDLCQEEENDYKKGSKEKRKGESPTQRRHQKKAPQILPRTKFSLLNSAHEEHLDGCRSHA